MTKPFGHGGRGLALASLVLLVSTSCDIGNSDGGPGPGPGVSGAISGTPGVPTTLRASAKGIQPEPNGSSHEPSSSADGRFVVYYSSASNLVAGDTNFTVDVFVRDRDADENGIFDESGGVATSRVSVATDGTQGNSDSYLPSISDDGRYVSFISYADNLVAGDTNFTGDVFVNDRDVSGDGIYDEPGDILTVRVSVDTDGNEGVSESSYSDISDDGMTVTFVSQANNLDLIIPDNNNTYDIFVHNRDVDGSGGTAPDQAGNISTVRVSIDSSGNESVDFSYIPYVSGDGRFVCFYSYSALVPEDVNFNQDIYAHDRDPNGDGFDGADRAIARVNVSTVGDEANSYSSIQGQCISDDGRFVVFYSGASNLAPGSNGQQHIYLRDRDVSGDGTYDVAGDVSTIRISESSEGSQADGACYFPSISGDGQRVAFMSLGGNLVPGDNNFTYDVFVRDIPTGNTTRASVTSLGGQANSFSYTLNISEDGNTVVFRSQASNLVPVDTNGTLDCFARDLVTNRTVRVSEGASTEPGADSFLASISGDGNFIAFASDSSDIVSGDTNGQRDVFLRDVATGANVRVSIGGAGAQPNAPSSNPSISLDGRFVAFQSTASNLDGADVDGLSDIFVRGLSATTLISRAGGAGVKGNGNSANPSISGNGQFIAYESTSSNLNASDGDATADIFVRDTASGATILASRATGVAGAKGTLASASPAISANGQFVVFHSIAENLDGVAAGGADPDTTADIYVRDIVANTTALVSVSSLGIKGNAASFNPSISENGRFVVFESVATNLAATLTTGGRSHIYVRDLLNGTTTLVSVTPAAAEADSNSFNAAISADGAVVAFESIATDLVVGDTNTVSDVFRYDVATAGLVRVSDNTGPTDSLPPILGVSGPSLRPSLSADGAFVAFESRAQDLVSPPELGPFSDIYRSAQ